MRRLGVRIVAAYLGAFTLFARDPDAARDERRLLLGSLEDGYHWRRHAGRGPNAAALLTLWTHLGELQPLAVLARLRAANQRAALAGIGGRRIALRLAALPTIASAAALFIWRADALGWIFLGFVILMLALMTWSARHAGARWLMPLIPLFMIWPLVEHRISPGRGPAISEALTFGLLLGAALAAHQLSRWGLGDSRRWRLLALLVVVPLWWAIAKACYAAAYWAVFPSGYGGPGSARFGLPADDALTAVSFSFAAWLTLYWLILAFTIARVAAHHRLADPHPPSRDLGSL